VSIPLKKLAVGDCHAALVAAAPRQGEIALVRTIDLDFAMKARNFWGTFQTQPPGLYAPLAQVPAGPPPV